MRSTWHAVNVWRDGASAQGKMPKAKPDRLGIGGFGWNMLKINTPIPCKYIKYSTGDIYVYIYYIYIQERGLLQEKGFHRWPEIEIVEPIQTAPGNLNKHLIFLTHLDDLFSWLLEWEKTEFFFYGVWMCMVSPNASPSLTGANIHVLNTDHDYHQGPLWWTTRIVCKKQLL